MTETTQWQTGADDTEYDPAPHGDGPTELDTGDRHDDDGAVLDSLVQPAELDDDEPAPATDAPRVLTEPSRIDGPRPVTRLRTETTTLPVDGSPVRVVPRNPDRVRLQVRLYGIDATVHLSDDQSKTAMRMGAFVVPLILTGAPFLDLDEHTGPLYVSAITDGENPVASVTVVEVTK